MGVIWEDSPMWAGMGGLGTCVVCSRTRTPGRHCTRSLTKSYYSHTREDYQRREWGIGREGRRDRRAGKERGESKKEGWREGRREGVRHGRVYGKDGGGSRGM